MSALRLAMVTDLAPGRRRGGSERYADELTAALERRGHLVVRLGADVPAEAPWPGIYALRVANQLAMRLAALERTVDLIHVHHPVAAALAAACSRLPRVRTLHGEVAREVEARRPWLRPLIQRVAGRLRNAALTTPSASLAERHPQARWMPGGVDLARFGPRQQPRAPEAPLRIGALARLAPERGLELMIDGVGGLLRSGRWRPSQLEVAIAGDGPEREALARRARRLHLPVRWLGPIDDPERFLRTLDLYVSPAPLESFGLALLEAMASALPIVAVASDGAGRLLGEQPGEPAAGLLTAADADALGRAVERLLTEPAEAGALAERARARSLGWSWDGIAASHERLYREVLSRQ